MRAISRLTGVSIDAVSKLLMDAGNAFAAYHENAVRGVKAKRIQCNEIFCSTYAKQKNVENGKAAPEGAGDTWTALHLDSKLIVPYLVGDCDAGYAPETMRGCSQQSGKPRATDHGRPQGLSGATESAVGGQVYYADLNKIYLTNA